ncbi:MAG: AzlD domain-containing protein [Oscillospiraceae bacterium]|nr:AzlD domain-containing protein [Oscillospiraceae bacterium]
MNPSLHTAALIAVMAVGTALLRFLPFLIFRHKTPAFIAYLGKVLPSAIIGMLVIYCLRETNVTASPFGLPELIATAIVVLTCQNRFPLCPCQVSPCFRADTESRLSPSIQNYSHHE